VDVIERIRHYTAQGH